MTKIYIPRLIESAEQAEALPIGTTTIRYDVQGVADEACLRVRGGWHATGLTDDFHAPQLVPHRDIVGDMALVPIEAEETRVRGFATLDNGDITVTVKTGLPPRKIRIGDGLIVAPGTPWEGA